MSEPFLYRRWHRHGDGWTLMRGHDLGDPYMIESEVIATSKHKWDTLKGCTNRLHLQRDIQAGWVELLREEVITDAS